MPKYNKKSSNSSRISTQSDKDKKKRNSANQNASLMYTMTKTLFLCRILHKNGYKIIIKRNKKPSKKESIIVEIIYISGFLPDGTKVEIRREEIQNYIEENDHLINSKEKQQASGNWKQKRIRSETNKKMEDMILDLVKQLGYEVDAPKKKKNTNEVKRFSFAAIFIGENDNIKVDEDMIIADGKIIGMECKEIMKNSSNDEIDFDDIIKGIEDQLKIDFDVKVSIEEDDDNDDKIEKMIQFNNQLENENDTEIFIQDGLQPQMELQYFNESYPIETCDQQYEFNQHWFNDYEITSFIQNDQIYTNATGYEITQQQFFCDFPDCESQPSKPIIFEDKGLYYSNFNNCITQIDSFTAIQYINNGMVEVQPLFIQNEEIGNQFL